MLHLETVTPELFDLLQNLMKDPVFDSYVLVGGTALSLQIGHRKSIDIDLFTSGHQDSTTIARYLRSRYPDILTSERNPVDHVINGVKVTVMAHQYPQVEPPLVIDNIRMATPKEIAAMKVNAIHTSGQRIKDFVDVFFLLERLSLTDILNAYFTKYPNTTIQSAVSSLNYFKDIQQDFPVEFIGQPVDVQEIKQRIRKATINPHKTFQSERLKPQKQLKNNRKGLRK